MKKILVLTSGGDAPGMNAAIRAIVVAGLSTGFSVYGAIGGYSGVISGEFKKLTLKDVENIIGLGGTILKSSRCSEFMTEDGFNEGLLNLKKHKFTCVVVLGGDGSMRGAEKLMAAGVNAIVLPCTIDNDMAYTPKTIGFDTALNTITTLLGNVRDTSSAHDRVCVVEVMGRHCGELALYAGLSAGAEVVLVPELNVSKKALMDKISASIEVGEKCVLVVVAEGVSTAEEVCDEIKKNLKLDAKAMNLGYVQRGGSPTVEDRLLASLMGYRAVELIKEERYGIALLGSGRNVGEMNLCDALSKTKTFDKEAYKINNLLSI